MTEQSVTPPPSSDDNLPAINKAWSRMIDCISHDMTTPLVTIRMISNALEEYLPALLDGYKNAVEERLIEPTIPRRYIKALESDFATKINDIVTEQLAFLSLVREFRQKTLATTEQTALIDVTACLQKVINNHTYAENQSASLIDFKCEHNIYCAIDEVFLEYLFDNLLSNALRAIAYANKGEITIWTEASAENLQLHFKDTGSGVSTFSLSTIFNRFFSKRESETVPGLGFCRLVLLLNGADMECHSEPEQFTEFVLSFSK